MFQITGEQWGIILGALGVVLAVPAFFFALPQVIGSIRAHRARYTIALFGPPATGKTSLSIYLQNKAAPKAHVPTIGSNPVGRIAYDLTGEKFLYFTARELIDVGGEFEQQWVAVTRHYDPDAFIYIVDTQNLELETNGLRHLIKIYKEIVEEKISYRIHLKAILILLNKCDLWGNTPAEQIKTMERYKNNEFGQLTQEFERLLGARVIYGCSSLTYAVFFGQNDQVLREFAELIVDARP